MQSALREVPFPLGLSAKYAAINRYSHICILLVASKYIPKSLHSYERCDTRFMVWSFDIGFALVDKC